MELAGESEDFAWLPQASELGWPGRVRRASDADRPPVRPDDTVLYAAELSSHLPIYTWGAAARIAIRATSIGYGLLATIHADSLDEVFDELRDRPVAVTDDELSHLGTVLVIRRVDADRRRVVAAHLVRPVARDVHGHLQRLGPAVLATWDAERDAFEHFGWGITPELAMRTGRRPGDFEIETDRRRDLLTDLGDGRHHLAGRRAPRHRRVPARRLTLPAPERRLGSRSPALAAERDVDLSADTPDPGPDAR